MSVSFDVIAPEKFSSYSSALENWKKSLQSESNKYILEAQEVHIWSL